MRARRAARASRTRARRRVAVLGALDDGHDDVAAAVGAERARCAAAGPSWNVSSSANGGWFSSAARRTTSGRAPVARVRDQPDVERLPALVHVLVVAVGLELARVVPGPDRAAHRADADVAAAHVVAVLRVVQRPRARARAPRRRPTPGPAPRAPSSAARRGRTASRYVARLGLDRSSGSAASAASAARASRASTRTSTYGASGRERRSPRAASSRRTGSRRGRSRAPARSRRAARDVHSNSPIAVVVRHDAVAPGVGAVVDRRPRARRRRREVDAGRLVDEPRDAARSPGRARAARARSRASCRSRASGSPLDRARADAVGAVAERRQLDREHEPAAVAAHRRQRPRQLHRHRLRPRRRRRARPRPRSHAYSTSTSARTGQGCGLKTTTGRVSSSCGDRDLARDRLHRAVERERRDRRRVAELVARVLVRGLDRRAGERVVELVEEQQLPGLASARSSG